MTYNTVMILLLSLLAIGALFLLVSFLANVIQERISR
jgi:hypothetical protein